MPWGMKQPRSPLKITFCNPFVSKNKESASKAFPGNHTSWKFPSLTWPQHLVGKVLPSKARFQLSLFNTIDLCLQCYSRNRDFLSLAKCSISESFQEPFKDDNVQVGQSTVEQQKWGCSLQRGKERVWKSTDMSITWERKNFQID